MRAGDEAEIFLIFAGVLGAVVGSFLNVCIYRMPRGIGLAEPRRSFCPSCRKTIQWFENLPVVSWLLLRGRCSTCGERIPARYLVVELLTAVLFAWSWSVWGVPLALVYWVLISLLVTGSFIDIEHFIIPDELTLGGLAAGLVFSVALPSLHGVETFWEGGAAGLSGALAGLGLLWLVVEGGKLAFGRKRHRFEPPVAFEWRRDGERAEMELGGERLGWEDAFSRARDVVRVEGEKFQLDGRAVQGPLNFFYDRLVVGEETYSLKNLLRVEGVARSITLPREAMGLGDVKLLGAIGAFLGWKAVVFTIFSGSVLGCVAAAVGIFSARDHTGVRLPFGPFLSAGAVIWILGGDRLAEWYFEALKGGLPG